MKRIGKYEILDEIGMGGMGIVYKAHDPVIGRDVAIKVVQQRILDAPALRERFYREARSAGRLSHPNITTLYDIGEDGGTPYLVMEFLGGTDLGTLIRQRHTFTLEEKIDIGLQICRALQYAHQNSVIHRDIKPDNIRVLAKNRIKIMDFGIARLDLDTKTLTKEGLGTPRYMSPEQIRGDQLDGRTDIFSFGVLFYELLTGTSPFNGDRVTTVIYKILHEDPSPIELEDTPFVDAIQQIVARCLAKDPATRYADFNAVARDLAALIRPPTGPTQTLPHVTAAGALKDRSAHSSSRRRYAALGIAAMLALGVGGYALFGPPSLSLTTSSVLPATEPGPASSTASAASDSAKTTEDTSIVPLPPAADDQDARSSEAASPSPIAATPPAETDAAPHSDADEAADVAPEKETLRPDADRAQRMMADARNRVINLNGSPPPAQLFQRADSVRAEGTAQYQSARFSAAMRSFEEAESLYVAVERALNTAAEQVTERTRASRDAASEAQSKVRSARAAVDAERHHHPTYQQAQRLEAQGNQAFEAGRYTDAESLFADAASLLAETNTLPTRTQEVQQTIDALVLRCKQAFEREDLEALRALSDFYGSWSNFFEVAHDIRATLTADPPAFRNGAATATIHFQIEYQNNRNRRVENQFTHSWTLEQRDLQWVLTDVTAQ